MGKILTNIFVAFGRTMVVLTVFSIKFFFRFFVCVLGFGVGGGVSMSLPRGREGNQSPVSPAPARAPRVHWRLSTRVREAR